MSAHAVHVVITGRVQGVWFRGWTKQEAERLCLSGWVRNRTDGSVEAVFAGPADAVADMLSRCHKGPPAARVDHVVVSDTDDWPDGAGFVSRPTV